MEKENKIEDVVEVNSETQNEEEVLSVELEEDVVEKAEVEILEETEAVQTEKVETVDEVKPKKKKSKKEKPKKKKSKKGLLIALIVVLVLGVGVGGVLGYTQIIKPAGIYEDATTYMYMEEYKLAAVSFGEIVEYKNSADLLDQCNYNLALELLGEGCYSDADLILTDIDNEELLGDIKEEMLYESYLAQAYTSLKANLKNPDSLIIYDIRFCETITDYPHCVIHYGAQNGWGGITEGYAFASYDDGEYSVIGSCDSLTVADNDTTSEMLTAITINTAYEQNEAGCYDEQRAAALIDSSNLSGVASYAKTVS
ncbi:MAG: hypothetical protein R3Y27_06390 [Clostridia bacterium]